MLIFGCRQTSPAQPGSWLRHESIQQPPARQGNVVAEWLQVAWVEFGPTRWVRPSLLIWPLASRCLAGGAGGISVRSESMGTFHHQSVIPVVRYLCCLLCRSVGLYPQYDRVQLQCTTSYILYLLPYYWNDHFHGQLRGAAVVSDGNPKDKRKSKRKWENDSVNNVDQLNITLIVKSECQSVIPYLVSPPLTSHLIIY